MTDEQKTKIKYVTLIIAALVIAYAGVKMRIAEIKHFSTPCKCTHN